jgi:GntR family transcriptional regulator
VTRQPDRGTGQPDEGGGLDFALDRRAEVPLGVQLAWALRARIHDGRLAPGQRLPGLRDLAHALQVNANTVRAVYQRLEYEGLIESHQGSGTYVAAAARPLSAAAAIAATAAREARQTGCDPREVAAALYVEQRPPPAEGGAERRRKLRTQIAILERVLGRLEAEHPGLVSPSRGPSSGLGPRLLDEQELELAQTHLIRRLAALQAAVDEAAHAQEDAAEQAQATAPKRAPRARAKTRPATAGA